jgi:hypothetical protein
MTTSHSGARPSTMGRPLGGRRVTIRPAMRGSESGRGAEERARIAAMLELDDGVDQEPSEYGG